MNKISLKEVFKNAAGLYKEQWKLLLQISGIQSAIAYVMVLSTIALNFIPQDNIGLLMLASLFRMAVSLFGLYFTIRMYASLVLATKYEFNGSHGTVGSYYRMAGAVTWRCIGYRLLLGLMFIIPVCFIVAAVALPMLEMFEIPIYISIILFIVGAIPMLILAVLFFYSIATVIVYRYPQSIFGYSVKLVKGNVWNVVVLVLIGSISSAYVYGFSYFLGINKFGFWVQAGLYLLEQIPVCIAAPFLIGLCVISMQMIEEKMFRVKEDEVI